LQKLDSKYVDQSMKHNEQERRNYSEGFLLNIILKLKWIIGEKHSQIPQFVIADRPAAGDTGVAPNFRAKGEKRAKYISPCFIVPDKILCARYLPSGKV
jgi:hypothetical protein